MSLFGALWKSGIEEAPPVAVLSRWERWQLYFLLSWYVSLHVVGYLAARVYLAMLSPLTRLSRLESRRSREW